MPRPGLCFTALALVIGLLEACGGEGGGSGDETTVCYDCGECGIQAPVDPGTIFIADIGVDSKDDATIKLQLQEGNCPGADQIDFRVIYAAGAVTVVPEPADDPIDVSKVTYNNSLYTWNDRDLTLATPGAGLTVELTFTDMGAALKVACTGVNREIKCTPL